MHGIAFLQDLAVVMIAAGIAAVVFRRLRQPVVLGYILAGVVIGPHTPPAAFIHDQQSIATLAELGVVFLLFSLGLEFNFRKLRAVGPTVLLAAALEISLMFAGGYRVGRWFGWGAMDALFLGAILSISSSTVIVKTLGELKLAKEPFARLVFGILVVEDLFAIVMLALLSGIAMTGTLGFAEAGTTVGKLGIFLAATVVGGLIAVPRLLGYVGRLKSDELLLVTVLALCFGSSLLAAKLGYSTALGAFLIGAMISESRELGRIEHLIAPVRDLFGAVFFVAIGLLIDPSVIAAHAGAVAVLTVVVLVGKTFGGSLGSFLVGNDTRTSLRVGMGLAVIGEFGFVIAALGTTLKVTGDFLYPIAVAVSVLTTLVAPHLIRGSDGCVRWFDRVAPRMLVANLGVYTRWVGGLGGLGGGGTSDPATRFVRKWLFQIAVNLALVAAVFLAFGWLADRNAAWWPEGLRATAGHRSVLWLAASVLSLPLFIASFRKLQALGLVVAETRVHRAVAGQRTDAIRSVVAHVIPSLGLVGLALFGLAVSSTLLPAPRELAVLVVVLAILAAVLWRRAIRVYSKAQVALEETFAQPPQPSPEPVRGVPAALRDADLASVVVTDAPHLARKLIRELGLRTRTGASIVAIERGGQPMLNPGPDEELLPGDTLVVLGTPSQLAEATAFLSGATPQPSS